MTAKQMRYTTTWSKTVQELGWCFEKWGVPAHLWKIETATDHRRDYNRRGDLEERRVSLRFPFGGKEILLTCDAQETQAGNLRVLYLAVDAMRLNEVRGLNDVMREAYLQLEAPEKVRDPYEVLGVRADAPMAVIEASYKAQAKTAHPDAGGSEDAFKEIAAAWERVKADRGVAA